MASVDEAWRRIEDWLAAHAPDTYASLAPGADPDQLAAVSRELGVALPEDLFASLRRHDGSGYGSGHFTVPVGQRLLSSGEIRRVATLRADAAGGPEPSGLVPFAGSLVVDCRAGGRLGAVVSMSRPDADDGAWPGVGDLLTEVADALRDGSPVRGRVPFVVAGRLGWYQVPEHEPRPRSVLALAAQAPEPGVPMPRRIWPLTDAGWIGGYGPFCLTFVHGVTAMELLRRFGAEPAEARPRDSGTAVDLQNTWTAGYRPVVRVGAAGDWAFGFEQGRAEGVRVEALRRLSAGTRAAALHFAGQYTELALAEDGELVVGYDTRQPDAATGREPGRLLPALRRAGLVPLDTGRYPDEDARAGLDVFAAELGIEMDGEALSGPLPSAAYLPALADPPPVRRAFGARSEPVAALLLAHAPRERLWPALLNQAHRLVAETGLDEYPELGEALRHAAGHGPGPVDGESPLGRRVRLLEQEAHAAAASGRDLRHRGLISELERRSWQRRADAARSIADLLRAPQAAAPALLRLRLDPGWRAELLADLPDPPVTEAAIEALAESERAEALARPRGGHDRSAVRRPQRQHLGANPPMRAGAVRLGGGRATGLRLPGPRRPGGATER